MTEEQWLASTHPAAMLEDIQHRGTFSGRKATLLMAAACRQVPGLVATEGSRLAVAAAEGAGDGANAPSRPGNWRAFFAELAENVTPPGTVHLLDGLARWPDDLVPRPEIVAARSGAQADLLRDIFGPLPFRTPRIDPRWQTPLVLSLAETAYEQRVAPDPSQPGWLTLGPDRLLVLADALEEAGADEPEMLDHLRRPGVHVRGCWVADLILTKEPTPSAGRPAAAAEATGLVRFRPSHAEGLPDVREVLVRPDRLEVNTAGSWVTFHFSRIGRRQESRLASFVRRLAGRAPWPVMVADRDWFHPPPDRFFLWYTDPPLRTCMPQDEPADHAASYFSRIQAVLAKGGYATFDLG